MIPMKTNPNRNEYIIRDAADTLLFITENFNKDRDEMDEMEFLRHIEQASQDIVYNLTTLVRNLTDDIDDE